MLLRLGLSTHIHTFENTYFYKLKQVGEYLNKKLISLSMRYPNLIGCIHGHGLYQGIEIVDPSKSVSEDGVLPPGSDVAYAVCDRLRELGVSSRLY